MTADDLPDIVIGGGISGIAAAVALVEAGRRVVLLEKRAALGGRATSFIDRDTGEEIDNCQHVVLGCCTNVLDLFDTLGVADRIAFTDVFHFVEPNGRRHALAPSFLPAPLHYLPALLRFGALRFMERLAVVRALLSLTRASASDFQRAAQRTMGDWLAEARQPRRAIERFWAPVLVGAVNEDLERACALPCWQVFLQGFLPHRHAARLGIPTVALNTLYSTPATAWLTARGSQVLTRAKVKRVLVAGDRAVGVELADGSVIRGRGVVIALPPDGAAELLDRPETRGLLPAAVRLFEASPITGIHLWFDRQVFDLPHAMLLDTAVQWVFPKPVVTEGGQGIGARQRLQLVVSASRRLDEVGQGEIAALAQRELAAAFPPVAAARLLKSVVVKETRATFSITPQAEAARPSAATAVANVALAGDWTKTGWPATLEGAVRAGRSAAATLLGSAPQWTADLQRGPLAAATLHRIPRRWPGESLDAVRRTTPPSPLPEKVLGTTSPP